MASFVAHPLIKPNAIERRLYQEVIVAQVEEKGNTLVVAPTALGKTVIAAMLCARMLEKNPEGKILFLAPTKPLAVQHQVRLREFLAIHPETINVLTGALSPAKRAALWKDSTIIAATPQTIENDVLTGKTNLNEVQLLIFDEAHRAVKDYSYVFMAKNYFARTTASSKRILALTASPGSREEDIQDICKNLYIQHIAVKTLNDPDVKPYMNDIHVEWKKVKLPERFYDIKKKLNEFIAEQLTYFKKIGYARNMHASFLRRVELLQLQIQLREDMVKYGATKPQLYQAVSRAAAVLKVSHAITLLESQGIHALEDYFDKMKTAAHQAGSPKAAKLISEHESIHRAYALAAELSKQEIEHPKIKELKHILHTQFSANPESRVLVFNHYRDSVSYVTDALNQGEGIRAARFIGQATKSKTDKGLSQKEQIALLEEFRAGTYNTLVASSVAEEGLDIPSVDLVVFYEPAPSEIRLIQRRGRTGRKAAGKVIILMAEKTMDEAMYWSSKRKEKTMHETLQRLSVQTGGLRPAAPAQPMLMHNENNENTRIPQANLFQFGEPNEKIFVFADTREQASSVARELSFFPNIHVQSKQLEVGDFVVGPDVVIERKTVEDFLSSVTDGRLLAQLVNMSQAYARPLLILEGKPEELFSLRNIHENAIIGMLASISLTYRIPILYTRDAKETAKFVYQIAKREQQGSDREIRLRIGRKGLTLGEQQQYIIEGLPLVGPTLAKSLLEHFGSIQKLMNASKEELEKVEMVGPKKAAAILHVLSQSYVPKKEKKDASKNAADELEKHGMEMLDDPMIQNEPESEGEITSEELPFD